MSVLIGPLQVLNGYINSVLRIILFLIFTILYQLRFMVPYKFLKLCGVFVQIVPKTLDNYPKVTVLNERSRIIPCNCMGDQAQPIIRGALWSRWPPASPWSTGTQHTVAGSVQQMPRDCRSRPTIALALVLAPRYSGFAPSQLGCPQRCGWHSELGE